MRTKVVDGGRIVIPASFRRALGVGVGDEVILELHQKGPGGTWRVIDRAKGPANFTASIADLATGKELTTSINWNVRSERGRSINVRLARAARVRKCT